MRRILSGVVERREGEGGKEGNATAGKSLQRVKHEAQTFAPSRARKKIKLSIGDMGNRESRANVVVAR